MRRREILHSPSDPRFYNVLTRSRDSGRSWSRPVVVPGYDWYGVECPSLTRLRNGDLLLLHWRWRWRPWPEEAGARTPLRYERPSNPWARDDDGTYIHRSRDGGLTWEIGTRLDTSPYPGAYTIGAAAELPDRTLIYAVTDIPSWHRIYLLRSIDGGMTWETGPLVASDPNRQFSEPCILCHGDRLLILIREERTGFIHQSESRDGGQTWTPPRPTPMWGCPPHPLDLEDGRLLCTYGHRRPPYGIRACLSEDGGNTWNIAHELVLQGDLPNANLGYPSSVLAEPGRVFTTYYGEDHAGVTCILGVRFDV
ncbi:MAG: sialidase family protein [Thermomicrobiales bacterium]